MVEAETAAPDAQRVEIVRILCHSCLSWRVTRARAAWRDLQVRAIGRSQSDPPSALLTHETPQERSAATRQNGRQAGTLVSRRSGNEGGICGRQREEPQRGERARGKAGGAENAVLRAKVG